MEQHILQNLHTHSRYSDGAAPPEEYVLAALQKGFRAIGFSDHAYAPYDLDCCIREENMPRYFAEIRALREAYRGKIEIYLGLENDALYPAARDGLDYIIGSVHYVRDDNGNVHCIDYLPRQFETALKEAAGGDIRELARRYYATVAMVALEQKPDIIGHLDLLGKLNKNNRYFDFSAAWYGNLVQKALKAVRASGCMVEVNTAGMRRECYREPYPARFILERMREMGIPVILSSDAHAPDMLNYQFEEACGFLRAAGYRSTRQMREGAFVDIAL